MNDVWSKSVSTQHDEVVLFRLNQLEQRVTTIQTDVADMKETLLFLRARFGDDPAMFQCAVHQEKMNNLGQKIVGIEQSQGELGKEVENIKKFIWRTTGGLAIVMIALQLIVAPIVVKAINASPVNGKPVAHESQATNVIPSYFFSR